MNKFEKLEILLAKNGIEDASVSVRANSLVIEGVAKRWEEKVAAGHVAAKHVAKKMGYRGTINLIAVAGIADEKLSPLATSDTVLQGRDFDVAIVGAGVIGAAIARELARWNLRIALIEKEYDVAIHASSRNDGMIHDGFAAKPGTKKAFYNVRGNRLWDSFSKDLGITFRRPGSLILFASPSMHLIYPIMAARAKKNDVDGWEYWSKNRVKHEEPHVSENQFGGFFLPSAGILSPYKATVALAENAAVNGVEVFFETSVSGFSHEEGSIATVKTNRGEFRVKAVINAAGNWSDVVSEMAGDGFFTLHQRRGTDMILDLETDAYLNHIVGCPQLLHQSRSTTKGGGLIKTIEGNVLVGPTAREACGRENYTTTQDEIKELEHHLKLNKKLNLSQVITYFAGVRACTYDEDFIVERSLVVPNLINAAGIQSPGLASAPAIAEDIVRMTIESLSEKMEVKENQNFQSKRVAPPELKRLSFAERASLISKNPLYGRIVCRCEEISEGEIREALTSPLPVTSLDAVKRRTRTGMGRCHGGFCTPRAIEIIADAKGIKMDEVLRKGPGSWILSGETKGTEGQGRSNS